MQGKKHHQTQPECKLEATPFAAKQVGCLAHSVAELVHLVLQPCAVIRGFVMAGLQVKHLLDGVLEPAMPRQYFLMTQLECMIYFRQKFAHGHYKLLQTTVIIDSSCQVRCRCLEAVLKLRCSSWSSKRDFQWLVKLCSLCHTCAQSRSACFLFWSHSLQSAYTCDWPDPHFC